ncbi:serine-rich adhesin for platelets-like [Mya arenaria]|uniref:serine-rich adhesin for platelets-like n=1 Tax=Mya arenaria TaxID=6604 RepID=UPI0022E7505A|nr:serine-rich adhesin for platelets-like [Mya arenaria]
MLRVIIIFACMCIVKGQFVKRFEFESVLEGKGTRRIPWRSGASNLASLHMFKGDIIAVNLCLPEATSVTIHDLIYSNDGESDRLEVFLDNVNTGIVNTEANSGGFGRFWDNFKSSGQVALSQKLSPGNHTLAISVTEGDCYGSEFDALEISLSVNVSEQQLWCYSELQYADKPTACAENIDKPEVLTTSQAPSPTTKAHSDTTVAQTLITAAQQPTTPSPVTRAFSPTPQVSRVATQTPSLKPKAPSSATSTASPTTQALSSTTQAPSSTTQASSSTTQEPSSTTQAPSSTSQAPSSTTQAPSSTTQARSSTTSTFSPTTQAPSSTTQVPSSTTSTASPTTQARSSTIPTPSPTTQAPSSTTPTPSPTTTPLAIVETTDTQTEATPVPDTVQQLSFETTCKDDTNVNIKFNPSVFRNTKVIARVIDSINVADGQGKGKSQGRKNAGTKPNRARRTRRRSQRQDRIKRGAIDVVMCESSIWQIGVEDKSNNELGDVSQKTNISYKVDQTNSFFLFPGTIDPRVTRHASIKYYIPKRFNIRRGRLDLTLGLVKNTSENVNIGLQYHNRAKKLPSDVEYETFSPSKIVSEWDFPANAVSPSLQNELTLVFDNASSIPISIDYVRLSYRKQDWPTTPQLFSDGKTWRVRGRQYRERKNRRGKQLPVTEGMRINVDDVAQTGLYKKVMFSPKSLPGIRVLTIYENGELFVNHETRKGRRMSRGDRQAGQQTDVSGFTLGGREHAVASVDIDTNKDEVNVNLEGGNYVKFLLAYTKTETTLTVLDTNMDSGPLSFFSTYISGASAAVTDMTVDGQTTYKIMDLSIGNSKGKTFKFVKNNADNSFDVSDEIEIVFP